MNKETIKSALKWYGVGLLLMTYFMGAGWIFAFFGLGNVGDAVVVMVGAIFTGLMADACYSIGAGLFSNTKKQ